MTRSANFPDGHSIVAFGQEWYFSPQALGALETRGPITESTLRNCVLYLLQLGDPLGGFFEVDYYGVPLMGNRVDGVIRIDL